MQMKLIIKQLEPIYKLKIMIKINKISILAFGNRSKQPPMTAATAPEAPITGTLDKGSAANWVKFANTPAQR